MNLSLCSVDYSIKDNSPILHLFCRDSNFDRKIIPVKDFKPYFYIEERNRPLIEGNYSELIQDIRYGYKDLKNNDLIRIYTHIPPHVRDLRKIFRDFSIKTYEADILFPLRYLIDLGIFTGIEYDIYSGKIIKAVDMPSRLRVLSIDIEVFAETEEEMQNETAPIIVYGIYDSLTDKYYIFTLKDMKTEELKKYLLESKELEIRFFKSEKKLLESVRNFIRDTEPDVILTFSDWDMKYTIVRMMMFRISVRAMSPIKVVRLSGRGTKISGIQILDIAQLYRTTLRKQKWETLEFIAKKELDLDALHHDKSVYEMWTTEPELVMQRNLRDVELVKILNDELQLITYFDTIRRTAGCNLTDTIFRSRVADILDLRSSKELNVVLPTRRFFKHWDYLGAKVFKCIKGVHKNVLVVDFTTMYPSICRALNIGYNTFIPGKLKNGEFTIENLEESFQPSTVKSFLIMAFDKLEPLRKPYKSNMKKYHPDSKEYKFNKAISDGLKSTTNAEYGKFGYSGDWKKYRPASRLYEPRVAAAITYVGRMIQGEVSKFLEKQGYILLYGDTDSLFIKLKTTNPKEPEELLNKLNKYTVKVMKEKLKTKIFLELEIDKIFESLMLLTKKRYGGKRTDGSYEWKGLELVKRDQAIVTIEVQEKLSKMALNGTPNSKIQEFFLEYCNDFKNKSIEEMAITMRLSKKPDAFKSASYHLKAFIYSRDILGINLEPGRRFYLVYVSKIPKSYPNAVNVTIGNETKKYLVDAIAFNHPSEIPKGFKINYEKMKEKTIFNKSEDILELIGTNLDSMRKEVDGYVTLNHW